MSKKKSDCWENTWRKERKKLEDTERNRIVDCVLSIEQISLSRKRKEK